MNDRTRNQGFTLIELMIVVAILGIAISLALPMMRESMLNARVRTATSDMYATLLKSRSDAIKRASNVVINFTGGGWNATAGTLVLMDFPTLPANVTLKICPTATSAITYSSSGRASGGRVRLYFYSSELSPQAPTARQIDIDAGGMPRVRTLTHSAADNAC